MTKALLSLRPGNLWGFLQCSGKTENVFPKTCHPGTNCIYQVCLWISFFFYLDNSWLKGLDLSFFFFFFNGWYIGATHFKSGQPLAEYLLSIWYLCSISWFVGFRKLLYCVSLEHRSLFSSNITVFFCLFSFFTYLV